MACTSCASDTAGTLNDPKWRRALWIALAINGGMFAVEIVAGIAGGSKALQADALDFFGDAANYAISLGVAGMALAWRAKAALLKGGTVGVQLAGPFEAVDYKVQWSAVSADLLSGAARGALGDRAKGALGGLLGGSATPAAAASGASAPSVKEQARDKAKEKAKDELKKLFGR